MTKELPNEGLDIVGIGKLAKVIPVIPAPITATFFIINVLITDN